ncbi:RidA family protein [Parvularcula sp. LCG005]|uniref:RidA family protein n=1 Tax=Parvularcula sp. LCG005 TaxID=3078805 RepID=UPI002943A954|nr:RidA family protein [Parvularcula sp. LCG005]WOI52750.1 RidA family protein [Parvularcula sp. LCG005]
MSEIETRLTDAGFSLPEPAAPVASYVPYTIQDRTLYISGQIPFQNGDIIRGILGESMDVEGGIAAARACALGILAQAKAACGGDLDRLDRCLKLGGFVASTPYFTDHPKVINGASDLMMLAMGEDGRHARAAVGVAALPLGAAVEVDAIFALK